MVISVHLFKQDSHLIPAQRSSWLDSDQSDLRPLSWLGSLPGWHRLVLPLPGQYWWHLWMKNLHAPRCVLNSKSKGANDSRHLPGRTWPLPVETKLKGPGPKGSASQKPVCSQRVRKVLVVEFPMGKLEVWKDQSPWESECADCSHSGGNCDGFRENRMWGGRGHQAKAAIALLVLARCYLRSSLFYSEYVDDLPKVTQSTTWGLSFLLCNEASEIRKPCSRTTIRLERWSGPCVLRRWHCGCDALVCQQHSVFAVKLLYNWNNETDEQNHLKVKELLEQVKFSLNP